MKTTTITKTSCCSTRQKIWGVVALAGLFACGLMLGISVGGAQKSVKNAAMQKQCDEIADSIVYVSSNHPGNWVQQLEELNALYEKNCAGHVATPKDRGANTDASRDTSDMQTCEVVEEILGQYISPEIDSNPDAHRYNIETYKKLIVNGCAENKDKYMALIQRENDILAALTGTAQTAKTCAEIENLLMGDLPNYNLDDSDTRIRRAKIYANLSERGCPENSQNYVNLAARELEIARALRDDNFSQPETVEVVETYKRLEMKQAASDVLQKVQKLTDPAIDFIIQVQKIIEE